MVTIQSLPSLCVSNILLWFAAENITHNPSLPASLQNCLPSSLLLFFNFLTHNFPPLLFYQCIYRLGSLFVKKRKCLLHQQGFSLNNVRRYLACLLYLYFNICLFLLNIVETPWDNFWKFYYQLLIAILLHVPWAGIRGTKNSQDVYPQLEITKSTVWVEEGSCSLLQSMGIIFPYTSGPEQVFLMHWIRYVGWNQWGKSPEGPSVSWEVQNVVCALIWGSKNGRLVKLPWIFAQESYLVPWNMSPQSHLSSISTTNTLRGLFPDSSLLRMTQCLLCNGRTPEAFLTQHWIMWEVCVDSIRKCPSVFQSECAVCLPASSWWEFLLLHIIVSIWNSQHFGFLPF